MSKFHHRVLPFLQSTYVYLHGNGAVSIFIKLRKDLKHFFKIFLFVWSHELIHPFFFHSILLKQFPTFLTHIIIIKLYILQKSKPITFCCNLPLPWSSVVSSGTSSRLRNISTCKTRPLSWHSRSWASICSTCPSTWNRSDNLSLLSKIRS